MNGSFAVIKVNGKILWIKREDNGLWELPGGGFENFEDSYKSVVSREIKEETGLDIPSNQLTLCAVLTQTLKEAISIKYGGLKHGLVFVHSSVQYVDHEPTIVLSKEHTDCKFFSYPEIKEVWEKFSSGPLWMYFAYLAYEQTGKLQEGTVSARRKWQEKDYFAPLTNQKKF